jgi:hypothetical protein
MLLAELRIWPKIPAQRFGVAEGADNRLETVPKVKAEINANAGNEANGDARKETVDLKVVSCLRPARHKNSEPHLER